MENIGATLRYLRESRSFSQREVADGIVDYSYYSRVENNKNNITHVKLAKILERLEIDIEEFHFLNNVQNGIEKVTERKWITKAYYAADIGTLEKLKKIFKEKFYDNGEWKNRYHYILCTHYMNRMMNQLPRASHVDEILHHLDSISYYTKNDIYILADFCKELPSEMVFHLYKKIFIEKKRRSSFELLQKDVLLFHLNMIDLALIQKKYKLAQEILTLVKNECFDSLDLLAVSMVKYYDGLFIILSGKNIDSGIELAKKGIMMLELGDLNYQAKVHREDLEEVVKNIEDSN